MKILLITHKPSFPKIDGGCVASAQIILGLEKMGLDYKIAMISTPKHPFQKEAFPKSIQKKIACHIEINTSSVMRNFLAWFNSSQSMFLTRFYDLKFEKQLLELCRNYQPDVIHLESLFAAIYLPGLKKVSSAKMILRSHNVEHQLWQDRLKQANVVKKWFLRKHVNQLKKEEIFIFTSVDGIATIAKNEMDFIVQTRISTPAVFMPMGIEIGTQESRLGNDFFHLAAMDWQPNINALNWFIDEVWCKSECSQKNLLHIAGKSLDIEDFQDVEGIKNHGMIADSQVFMCEFGIMLVPLFEGSGLRIKIIEAGALGVPIIASAKAVEGIGLENGKHYMEANTAIEFQDAMQHLMNDVSLRRKLGSAIREFMQKNFDQNVLNSQLIEFYQNI